MASGVTDIVCRLIDLTGGDADELCGVTEMNSGISDTSCRISNIVNGIHHILYCNTKMVNGISGWPLGMTDTSCTGVKMGNYTTLFSNELSNNEPVGT